MQNAGAWQQVLLISIVGVVLTYVRSRTGTVLASFLIHVSYNSFLFAAFVIGTRGHRQQSARGRKGQCDQRVTPGCAPGHDGGSFTVADQPDPIQHPAPRATCA